MGVGGFPSNLADCILIPAGVVRCGETWGRFMLGGKYLEWSDPLFLLHPRWLELFQRSLIRRLFASKALVELHKTFQPPGYGQRALILKFFLFYCQAKMVKRQHKNGQKEFSFHCPLMITRWVSLDRGSFSTQYTWKKSRISFPWLEKTFLQSMPHPPSPIGPIHLEGMNYESSGK